MLMVCVFAALKFFVSRISKLWFLNLLLFSQTTIDKAEVELSSLIEGKSAALKIEMASLVTAEALRRGTTDNVTVVIIWLKDGPKM